MSVVPTFKLQGGLILIHGPSWGPCRRSRRRRTGRCPDGLMVWFDATMMQLSITLPLSTTDATHAAVLTAIRTAILFLYTTHTVTYCYSIFFILFHFCRHFSHGETCRRSTEDFWWARLGPDDVHKFKTGFFTSVCTYACTF